MTPEQIRASLVQTSPHEDPVPSASELAKAEAEDEAALNKRLEDPDRYEPEAGLALALLMAFVLVVGIAIGFLAGHHGHH